MKKENVIELAKDFLNDSFKNSEYMLAHPNESMYRIEHSYRVANIGRSIAVKEDLNVENTVIACLLHDVSYCMTFKDGDEYVNHGRYSAKMTRHFLEDIGLGEHDISSICYGIAIHVDGKADFEGEKNAFTLTVGDCDSIDRFDAYRIYETLKWKKYEEMNISEKEKFIDRSISRLNEMLNMTLATKAADELWKQRINFYISFYERLIDQIRLSRI